VVFFWGLLLGATPLPEITDAGRARILVSLRAFETRRRHQTDVAALAPSNRVMGPDPYRLRSLPGTRYTVAVLRGEDRLVLLDDTLAARASVSTPASPTGLAVLGTTLYTSGSLGATLERRRVSPEGRFGPPARLTPSKVTAIADLAAGPEGVLYLVETATDRLIVLSLQDGDSLRVRARRDLQTVGGPFRVARVGGYLVVDGLLGHALEIFPVDEGGVPIPERRARIVHDGPLWCFDARPAGDGLRIVAGGVEDHPLDRSGGFFGYIDSFLYLYEARPGPSGAIAVRRQGALNLSEYGVVTPKAIRWTDEESILATGYGAPSLARIRWPAGSETPATVAVIPAFPGITDLTPAPGGGWIGANPLLDAWVRVRPNDVALVPLPVHSPPRDPEARLGEMLFFTTLLAPANRSAGARSRFTCETCHFEGGVDGRTHYTGRDSVFAVTKPLFGLFNNKPYFSRALDPDLTGMVTNEFRVAGAGSDRDPWQALTPAEAPWLEEAIGRRPPIGPEALRRAFMTFLMGFTHAPNPAALAEGRFKPLERRGAEAFRDRCESCHRARLLADAPLSRVPFERWEGLVLSEVGPLVWASSRYARTGVRPTMHERGTRIPSLRRVLRKRPYFTNGSAPDLDTVLRRVRTTRDGFYHDNAPTEAVALPPETRAALAAFLRLL